MSLPENKRRALLDKALLYWRDTGFPYSELSDDDIASEYARIDRVQLDSVLTKRTIKFSTVGLRLANSFHPQMWHIPSQYHILSPIDHFRRDETLRKQLEKAAYFWPNRSCWNAYNVRNLFGIYAGGRVANFRPTAAKALIEKYSLEGTKVLDFCSGFGGRLLGASPLNRYYLGIDVSQQQVKGLLAMHKAVRNFSPCYVEIMKGRAEQQMSLLKANSFDLIFTSPPYFDLEKYCTAKDQSYVRYASYEDWKERFLTIVLYESSRLLKRKGVMIINISNTNKYPLAEDFLSIAKTFFTRLTTYDLRLHARPVQRKNGMVYKNEPVYILIKK